MPSKKENISDKTSAGRNEVTKQKVHKHLVDINDVITEQDISNVSTEEKDVIRYDKLSPEEKKTVSKEIKKISRDSKKKEKEKGDGNNTPDIETPWNVLG